MSDQSPLGPVIVDIEGCELGAADRELLQHPLVGGLIFFARNFHDKAQLLELVGGIRACRPDLVLAVDQEGGRVQRFQQDFTRLPPMQAFWSRHKDQPEFALPLASDCGWLLAAELIACDIDISFAPVLDVDDNCCPAIGNRSFAPHPQVVSQLAGAFIDGMHAAGMACTGKHFPGHGSVTGDSHHLLPVDERSFADIEAKDWRPFADLVHQLDAVMPAHIQFPAVDSKAVGFSNHWLQRKLRGDLGFKGIIFSDDLTMAGAASIGSYAQRAEQALSAGCDVVLVCNNRTAAIEVIEHLSQQGIEPNDRLRAMKKRKSLTWDELMATPRWRQTRNQLQALVESIAK